MHLRTMMWLNANGMAGLLTLGVLLALGSIMDGLDAMQQLGFILRSYDGGWAVRRAVGGGTSRNEPAPGGVPWWAANLTQVGFRSRSASSSRCCPPPPCMTGSETTTLLVGAGLCGVVWHGVGWLALRNASLALKRCLWGCSPVLILPYSLLLSVLS